VRAASQLGRSVSSHVVPETNIDEEPVELEREERVAKQQVSDPTAEVIRSRLTSAGDTVVLCTQPKQ